MRKRLKAEAKRKIEKLCECLETIENLPAELMDHAIGGHVSDTVWVTIPYEWSIYRPARQALAEQGWKPVHIHENVEPGSRATTLRNDGRSLIVLMSPKASSTCELELIEEKEVVETRRKYRVVCG